jgi:hypothetical protein
MPRRNLMPAGKPEKFACQLIIVAIAGFGCGAPNADTQAKYAILTGNIAEH